MNTRAYKKLIHTCEVCQARRPLADRLRDGAEWLERDGLLKSAELAREAAAELDCLRNVIYYAMNSQK